MAGHGLAAHAKKPTLPGRKEINWPWLLRVVGVVDLESIRITKYFYFSLMYTDVTNLLCEVKGIMHSDVIRARWERSTQRWR